MNTPWPQVPALVLPALGDTAAMVGIVMVIVVLLGTPLGVLLHNTSPLGLFPRPAVNAVISWIANLGRSLPFLVLLAAVIPFTQFVVGTNIGIQAAIVPMSLAGIPFFARLVENAIREVPSDITNVGLVSGGSTLQIIRSAQLAEALPGLFAGFTINVIAMIEYSAIAGAVGAGGIGYLAVNYGYQRFDGNIMLVCVLILIALAQSVQFLGDRVVRRVSGAART
ncbi:MAG: D-methionine transport system permease protein [Actinomycetota bacterium]|jgi:ABC-type methionine transport system permease subunit|nr:D-methionine transport system permease protein [Actinomycetota bacterium]